MKVFIICIALLIGVLRANAQGRYGVEVWGSWLCDSARSGVPADYDSIRISSTGPWLLVWYKYIVTRDGIPYMRFYILCDGRIVQEMLPHDDIQTDEFAVIGWIPGGSVQGVSHTYTSEEFPWGLHLVIKIYVNDILRVVIEYPYPGSTNAAHPAFVTYT